MFFVDKQRYFEGSWVNVINGIYYLQYVFIGLPYLRVIFALSNGAGERFPNSDVVDEVICRSLAMLSYACD